MIGGWLDQLLEWLIDRLGGLELLQLVLLGVTLECAGLGLSVVVARLSSGFILILIVISGLTAWTLTRTQLSNWGFGLTGALSGSVGLSLTVGQIGRALINFPVSLFLVLKQLFQKEPLDLSALAAAWQGLAAALAVLVSRFENWFHAVRSNTLIIDPMVTAILWGLAVWLAVFWAFWWVRRRAFVLVGLLPAVTLLGYNVFYTNSGVGITWLVLTAGGILTLQACASYGIARQRWATSRKEREEIEPRLAFLVVLLTAGMLLAGRVLPSMPVHQIANAINRAFHPTADQSLAASLGLEQTPTNGFPVTATPIPSSGINSTESHPIGPGPIVNQDIVMLIAVDGYNPPPSNEYFSIISQNTEHYYWRGQTYDSYSGHNWVADSASAEELATGQSFQPNIDLVSLPANYKLITQHVTRLQTDNKTVFAAGEPLSLDQPSTVLKSDTGEIISAYTQSSHYAVTSRIQSPSVEQLRAAGSNYPPAMRRYLELPDEVPQRVLDLALNLTADQPTPYDRAAVLEAYLRQFPYSRNVPGPPPDQDAVDYFLFDLKTGYCDYYASAMVIMARAAGMPARLVLGYSEGIYDQAERAFVVRAANAHAWAEIFFPNIGWVKFEPTPIQPRPIRPGQVLENSQTANLPPPGQEARFSIHLERTWQGRFIQRLLIITAAMLFILFLPLEAWWLSLLPTDRVLQAIFRRLYRYGHFFRILSNPSRTPNEFARGLVSAMEGFVTNKNQRPLIADLQADLAYLTGLYNGLLFSEHPPLREEKREAIRAWRHFRRGVRQIRRRKNLKFKQG